VKRSILLISIVLNRKRGKVKTITATTMRRTEESRDFIVHGQNIRTIGPAEGDLDHSFTLRFERHRPTMGKLRSSGFKREGCEVPFQPDQSRANRLKGEDRRRRRLVLRYLYRAAVEGWELGPPGRRHRRRNELKAAKIVAVGAGLHMLATMWHHPPPPSEDDDDDGLNAFVCAGIWGTFWFVLTDLLGMKGSVVAYGALAVCSLVFSHGDPTSPMATSTTAPDAMVGAAVGPTAPTTLPALIIGPGDGGGLSPALVAVGSGDGGVERLEGFSHTRCSQATADEDGAGAGAGPTAAASILALADWSNEEGDDDAAAPFAGGLGCAHAQHVRTETTTEEESDVDVGPTCTPATTSTDGAASLDEEEGVDASTSTLYM
jgi:hypothetical protein